jgi:undecaprenyl-phosphate galactose phosphotransferase/putative colanic acid biosynthesis UDP-glucose lipid carrier transferase
VGPTVLIADMIVLLGVSVISGLVYNLIFFGSAWGTETHLAIGLLACVNTSAVLAARGDYAPSNLINFRRQVRDILAIWSGAFLLLLGVVFSMKAGQNLSRGFTLVFFISGLLALVAWRGVVAQYIEQALSTGAFAARNVVLIAEKGRLAGSRAFLEMRRCGYMPVRMFELNNEDLETHVGLAGSQIISDALSVIAQNAIEAARSEAVVEILLLIGWQHTKHIETIVEKLSILPIPVHLLPDESVTRYLGRRTISVGALWAAEVQRAPLTTIEQFIKRCFDVIGAGVALLLLSPLMLFTALLVKFDSRGPVFFLQTRNGFSGRAFKIVKFRSMHVLEDGPAIRQATRDDPRVTTLGRWLRRSNIDELPQLFNVLYGNMSLVGPRPHAVAHNSEFEKCIANYAYRHHVKPGITGWAQVNGLRGETPTTDLMARRVELDLFYINNWSIWLDIKILLKTLLLGIQPTGY